MTKINRKTGSLLDILGTCGGLMRALTVITSLLINPYTLYALKSQIALNLVRIIPSNKDEPMLER